MKAYNPKEWFGLIFNQTNNPVFKQLNWAVLAFSFLTALIVYFEQSYLNLSDNHPLKNFSILHSLLGFAISILLVFRTNTAYDRWWEGRRLWGSLTNTSRAFALKIMAIYPKDSPRRLYFKRTIPLYARVLRQHLQAEKTRLALDDLEHPEFNLTIDKHLPNQVMGMYYKEIQAMYVNQEISSEQLLAFNHDLNAFVDICGGCERIKNTPIPYSYSSFLKRFIFFYVISLPVGLSFSLGYYSIPIVAMIFYVMAGLELVAEEIEDPFGTDLNDLPMEKIANNIKVQVGEILD